MPKAHSEVLDRISRVLGSMNPNYREPRAFAPIRTSPRRTYDPLKELRDPEGGHVPMLLARLAAEQPKQWNALSKAIDSFGAASGLFKHVQIKRLGTKNPGEPFQVQVKVSGSAFNLVDVGYGVSQLLPLLVDLFNVAHPQTFLIQQPEVHLHPRAQAQLGTLFSLLATLSTAVIAVR